jgi:cobyrinic acid a,c-diamide synthase
VKLFSSSLRSGIAIAGVRGGSGKTLLTIGIIKALSRKGFSISSFKKGPDYIDPAWLSLASGRECRNLDAFLMPENKIIETYLKEAAETDIAVVEGNRGLFDGQDMDGTYSFSELVKLLRIPLILVVDCSKSTRTLAAVVHGCETFDKNLKIHGVILNNIAGERHRRVITDSINNYCRAPVLGYFPRFTQFSLGERHLGLVPVSEHAGPDNIISKLGDAAEKNVDIDAIIKISGCLRKSVISRQNRKTTDAVKIATAHEIPAEFSGEKPAAKKPVIGVILDSSFNFYYRENLEALESSGAKLLFLNSLKDTDIPGIDGLYIGGGFPETHAELLHENKVFRQKLKDLISNALPVYAECGGLIYLSEAIIAKGRKFQMAGIFPFEFEISEKPAAHGYTVFEVDEENPFYKKGTTARGHEFRYSRIINPESYNNIRTVFKMRTGTGINNGRDGIIYKNCLATFSHTHAAGENISWPEHLVKIAGGEKNHLD